MTDVAGANRRRVTDVIVVIALISLPCVIVVVIASAMATPPFGDVELQNSDLIAYESLYGEPIITGTPPGSGESTIKSYPTTCVGDDVPPGLREWILIDDGRTAMEHYKQMSREQDWLIVDEQSIRLGGRNQDKPNLILEKDRGDYTFALRVWIFDKLADSRGRASGPAIRISFNIAETLCSAG